MNNLKISLSFAFTILTLSISSQISSVSDLRMQKYDSYKTQINLDYIDGKYNIGSAFSESDPEPMIFEDSQIVTFEFNSDSNKGTITYEWNNSTKDFQIETIGKHLIIKTTDYQKNAMEGIIIALDEKVIRIVFLRNNNNLMMQEYTRLDK